MTVRCPLYVELCAGSAAVGLRLLGISRPPISFMGAKTSLAGAILGAMGLQPGQGAEAVVLVDAGPWGHVWGSLLDPTCSQQVAKVLRSWAGEDPRALWERLAATAPADSTIWAPGEVAAYLWVQGRTCNNTPAWPGAAGWVMTEKRSGRGKPAVQRGEHPDHRGMRNTGTVADRIEAIASWLVLQGRVCNGVQVGHDGERLVCSDHATGRTQAAAQTGPGRGVHQATIAERVDWLATWLTLQAHSPSSVPVVVENGEWRMGGDPNPASPPTKVLQRGNKPPQLGDVAGRVERIAAWLFRRGNSWRGAGDDWRRADNQDRPGQCQITPATLAERVDALTRGPVDLVAALRQDATALQPPDRVPDGTVVYCDPPYEGRTGYGYDLPRARVLEVARAWADAGALVSEAEPLPLPGWHHVEITSARTRHSADWQRHREFLTMNRPSAVRVSAPLRQTTLAEVLS